MKKCVTLLLAAVLAVGSAFSSQAGSAFKKEVPLTLHMDINNRQTPIYDGYTSYIMGNRASEKDTFTVTKNSDTLNLDDVTLSYYRVTYDGGYPSGKMGKRCKRMALPVSGRVPYILGKDQ